MKKHAILLRYHEIALKGDNRSWFEKRLALNSKKSVARALGDEAAIEVVRHHGRILLEADWNPATQTALSRVFGLSSFSPMRKVQTDKELIQQAVVEEFDRIVLENGLPSRFCVRTRRSDKVFTETSPELDRYFGGPIKEKYPTLVVDLKNPEITIGIEIRDKESFIWKEKIQAAGGLPVGTNGRVLSLLSGGLDSPVAAIMALKRGSPTAFLHFHGTPYVGDEALEKVEDLARVINYFQPEPEPLYVVPFGKIQEKIALATPPRMRTLLYRRMMIRIANEVARMTKAHALVTGESVGQVASQTIENISTVNAAAAVPILRPLISYDKDEIIAIARKWGTFDISIRPATDCCTLFADRHPTLRSTVTLLEEQEKKLSLSEWTQDALQDLTVHILGRTTDRTMGRSSGYERYPSPWLAQSSRSSSHSPNSEVQPTL